MKFGPTIPKINSKHTAAMGRLLVEWSNTEPALRPKTIGHVKSWLEDYGIKLHFPPDYFSDNSSVEIITTSLNEWVVRLPPIELIEQVLLQIRTTGSYPVDVLPSYFRAYPERGKRYDENFMYARLADFAVTQCG